MLSALDLTVVVAYIAATTWFGARFARSQTDTKTYFVGDRGVAWPLVLASIVATETSTVTFLSLPGMAYRDGGDLSFLQLAIGYLIGRSVIASVLLPQYFRGELFSAYQLLRERFGPEVQRTASGIFLLTRTVADGLRLFLTALLLKQFTGWSVPQSVAILGGVTIVYTYLGGMQAVIWTDLIQFLVYTLGASVAGLFILSALPGGWEAFAAFGTETGRFTIFHPAADLTRADSLWAGLIGGAFFTMASHGADQLMVQRYLCSRSLAEARLALVASAGVVLLQFALFLLIGVGLAALKSHGVLDVTGLTKENDEVFGRFIVRQMPTGLVGLVIAAVLAAAMSTLSSSLNSSANAFVSDFYQPLRSGRGDGHYLAVAKAMTLTWGVSQIGVALAADALDSPTSLINQVLSVAGFTTGLVLGLFILGGQPVPPRSRSALIGLAVGFLAVFAVWLPTTWDHAVLAWPWYAPLGAGTTVLIALLANLVAPREES